MKSHIFQPESALQKHILQYVFIEEHTEIEKPYLLPPNGIPGLVIQYKETFSTLQVGEKEKKPSPRAFLVGIYKNKLTRVHKGEVGVMGVMFHPTSMYHLFAKHCQQFSTNVITDLSEVVGQKYDSMILNLQAAPSYREKIEIFEHFIIQEFNDSATKFNMIDDIAKEIFFSNGIIKISDLLQKYKLSRRWLEKGFSERLGVSPKYYLDLIRFNHMIRLLRSSPKHDWNKIVLECGFYDHPHLIRQFKKFTGSSPKLLMEQDNELIEFLLGKW